MSSASPSRYGSCSIRAQGASERSRADPVSVGVSMAAGLATLAALFHCNTHPAPQRIFPACQNLGTGGALVVADPITGRAPEIRRRQWDKTSEVSQVLKHRVHGASRWWALSKAVKQHSWKQS